jgi:DtxR family Mn-dependent transcriptional regulator
MRIACKVSRKHRLLERFLHDSLSLGNEKVHLEACRMEHSLSDETAAALCDSLKNPRTCPDDGKPIPACTLEAEDCTKCKSVRESEAGQPKLLTQLSNLRPGEMAHIAFTRNGSNTSQSIMDMGLSRGTVVKMLKAAPFQGPLEISVSKTVLALSRELANKIFVEVEEKESKQSVLHGPHHIFSK